MSTRSFRFLHASDLHLDRPLGGLTQASPELENVCVDASLYLASFLASDGWVHRRRITESKTLLLSLPVVVVQNEDFRSFGGDLEPQVSGR